MTTIERKCANCAAWRDNESPFAAWGECRRHAPRPALIGQFPQGNENHGSENIARFPDVDAEDWCLEFVPKDPAE
jgi:hypothetical protein